MNEIKNTIEHYVLGTKTGDVDLLKSVFHDRAIMSGDLFTNKLIGETPELFFNDIEGEIADSTYSYEIKEIFKEGEIAVVNLYESNLKGTNFSNWFQLQKINGKWLIVSKLFTSE